MYEAFLAAAAVAVLLVGAGFAWVSFTVVDLLKHVRSTLLPNVDLTLTEFQKNLNRIDTLTKDVDTTVSEANELVNTANRTVRSVENGVNRFNQHVYVPGLIALASAREGIMTAWRSYRERKAISAPAPVQQPAAPVFSHRESPVIEVVPH